MDSSKVYSLIYKLRKKYGLPSKGPTPEKSSPIIVPDDPGIPTKDTPRKDTSDTKSPTCPSINPDSKLDHTKGDHPNKEECPESSIDWCLSDKYGQRQKLPKTMIFLGREECDILLQSPSVDKRHAVVTFDHYLNKFKIKDLSTKNGTFVNEDRITEQSYVTLDHLDAIRLGYDPAVYRVERMDKLELGSEGQPGVLHPGKAPVWASSQLTHMAECKGCIAEQQIHHTCGGNLEMRGEGSHGHPHPTPPAAHNPHCPAHDGVNGDSSRYHTWPRKQDRICPITNKLQKEAAQIDSQNNKTVSPPRPCAEISTMNSQHVHAPAPTSVANSDFNIHCGDVPTKTDFHWDTVLCKGEPMSHLDNGIMKPERDDNCVTRRETMVEQTKLAQNGKTDVDPGSKGTPLYGQPTWWGEEDKSAVIMTQQNGSALREGKFPHTCTDVDKTKPAEKPLVGCPVNTHWDYDPEKYKSDPKYSLRYMEIPARDTDPERDKPAHVNHDSSYNEPLSRDSLSPDRDSSKDEIMTPGENGLCCTTEIISPEKDTPSVSAKIPKPESAAAMAFTVDLGDEKPSKKMNMSGSLSEFVPSKIRRSFRERSEKTTSKAVPKEQQSMEDGFASPTRQKRLEDLWTTADSTKPINKKGEATRKASKEGLEEGVISDGEEEELSSRSDIHPAPIKKGSKQDRKSPKGRQTSSQTSKSKPSANKTKSVETIPSIPLSDPAQFLIDKMFEDRKGYHGTKREQEVILQVTEHALYKESSGYDSKKQIKASKAVHDATTYLKPKKSNQEPHSAKSANRLTQNHCSKENVIDAEEGEEEEGREEVEEDRTSEAGTYTIESDVPGKGGDTEVEEARQSIDKVFGVGLHRPRVQETGVEGFPRSDMDLQTSEEAAPDEDEEEEDEGEPEVLEEDLDQLEWVRAGGGGAMLSSMEVEVGSGYDKPDDIHHPNSNKKTQITVQQPTPQSLTKQRIFLKDDRPRSTPEGQRYVPGNNSPVSRSPAERPPSCGQKKRPGTGRKLPSLPLDKCSPHHDNSPRLSDIIQRSGEYSPRGENPVKFSPVLKEKSVTISSHVITHEAKPTKLMSHRSDLSSDIFTNVTSLASSEEDRPVKQPSSKIKSDSARSLASIDTEILLKDTETVMAAMEARMVNRRRAEEANQNFYSDCDSDMDVSSTVAVVNGEDLLSKPYVLRKKQGSKVLSQQQSRVKSQRKASQIQRQESLPVPKVLDQRTLLECQARKLSLPCDTQRSVLSDVVSDIDFDTASVRSDASTDYSESSQKPTRSGSKGKGKMTMTRPNRAFELRRLRAEGSSVSPDPTKSDGSSVSVNSSTPKSSTRPKSSGRTMSSGRPTSSGSRPKSTGMSEGSLGAEIARKSKENAGKGTPKQNFTRTDGGRYSLRSARSTTSTVSSKSSASSVTSSTMSDAARKKELRDLKSNLNGKQDLTITGVSSKSRSQPQSRSNSPRTQERNAWKRRKEYDPRKAVAEAKAKAKAAATPSSAAPAAKPKPVSPQKNSKRMTRSASYTNPEDFNKFRRESSIDSASSDDLSGALNEEAVDTFDNSRFKRRPFRARGAQSMTSIRDHGTHSGDENSSSLSEDSPDLHVCYGMLGLRPYKSAFTPPPKTKSPALLQSPPLSPPLRRARDAQLASHSAQSASGLAHQHSAESLSQSYDNLIISSIYQLSLKLKATTDRTLQKLRENQRVSGSPSPVYELSSQPTTSEIPAWNAANQELAAILKNLRKMDHHIHVIDRALFPEEEGGTESSRLTSREKKQYLQEIQRIRDELAGFRPIDNPEEVWKLQEDESHDQEDDETTSNLSEIEDFVEEFY